MTNGIIPCFTFWNDTFINHRIGNMLRVEKQEKRRKDKRKTIINFHDKSISLVEK